VVDAQAARVPWKYKKLEAYSLLRKGDRTVLHWQRRKSAHLINSERSSGSACSCSWRIAVNHFRNEAHQRALASRLRTSGAKCKPPPWSIKTRRSRRYRPTKSRATPCTMKSGPTQNSNGKYTTPYASNIRSGSSRTATVLPVISTRGDSPNCLPYLLRAEHARPKP